MELHDAQEELFVDWPKEESQDFKEFTIDWRTEIENAAPDEGDVLNFAYLNIAEGKSLRDMIKEEMQENYQWVRKAKVNEISGLYEFGCFKRWPRNRFHNIIDVRWVIAWNMVEGNVGVKCVLTVCGFKAKLQYLDTYAGITSISGQRFANVIAAENKEFILLSFDVSQVFANGLIVKESSDFTGTEVRPLELDVPKQALDCLRQIKGLETFDPAREQAQKSTRCNYCKIKTVVLVMLIGVSLMIMFPVVRHRIVFLVALGVLLGMQGAVAVAQLASSGDVPKTYSIADASYLVALLIVGLQQ